MDNCLLWMIVVGIVFLVVVGLVISMIVKDGWKNKKCCVVFTESVEI